MFSKLAKIFKTFSFKERVIFIVAVFVFVVSSVLLSALIFRQQTIIIPSSGGEYTEGVIGQPTFINPILSGANEVDRDITEIVFSNIIDISESIKISKNEKIWNIRLKENLKWHDGKPITSDDVIFTIETIQNPDANSSLFNSWQKITAERVSEREIKIVLPQSYVFFDSILKELRPIPKHIFASIPSANLRISNYNLKPIGSGPFKFVSFQKKQDGFIAEYQFRKNDDYFNQKPYLQKFNFVFFQNEKELIDAFNAGTIDGGGGLSAKNVSEINISHQLFKIKMPKYYAIFFNQYANNNLKEKNVRLALNYAIDKNLIAEKIFNNETLIINDPLMTDIWSEENYNVQKAVELLDSNGWKINDENIREKKDKKQTQKLEFTLIVPDLPFLVETGNLIKEQWANIGVKLNIEVLSSEAISEKIQTRNYEMILFGNILGDNPDLSSFWHSSERFYPGLNLALYENKNADNLMEAIRANFNQEKRNEQLFELQTTIENDSPAIFLFSPYYLYASKNWLKGFNEEYIPLADYRFANIEQWYTKTARAFK